MKYIPAEKTDCRDREADRKLDDLRQKFPIRAGKDTCESRVTELSDMLSFITSLQQEQPEVDLEKDAVSYCYDNGINISPRQAKKFASHFYNPQNAALEKAAQHAYESWMGGTMNDVRRDMVELGKVLNAGKEESK